MSFKGTITKYRESSMYEFHELANIFPLMSDREIALLADDIAANGQRDPIVLCEGKILDGRNRALAFKLLGQRQAGGAGELQTVDYTDRFRQMSPLDFVISKNLHRRHLNESQRAAVAVEVKRLEAARAKERKLATQNNKASEQRRADPVNLPGQVEGDARDLAAEKLGVSGRSVDFAEKVLNSDTAVEELKDAVRNGEVAVSSAAVVADLPAQQQRDALTRGKKGVAEAARRVRRGKRSRPPELDPITDPDAFSYDMAKETQRLLKEVEKAVARWPEKYTDQAYHVLHSITQNEVNTWITKSTE